MAVSFLFIIVIILLPIAALVTGVTLVVLSGRRGAPYPVCGACKYDLTGTIGVGTRCPECGSDFAVAGIIPPSGRRNPGMLIAGLALIAVPLVVVALAIIPALTFQARRAAARPIPPVIVTVPGPTTPPPIGSTQPPPITSPAVSTTDPNAASPPSAPLSPPANPSVEP